MVETLRCLILNCSALLIVVRFWISSDDPGAAFFLFLRPIYLLILRVSLPTCTSLSHGSSFAAILSIGIDLRSAWSF